jgi:hypothetical protein
MGSLKRAKERRAWLGAVSRQYRDGWGRALVSMGADFSASEWAAMSGLPEEAIRWILLMRREDIEDE